MFEQKPILVGRIFHPGRSYGCSPVRATGGLLPGGRQLLAFVTGNEEGIVVFLMLWVRTNVLYTALYTKCVTPVGHGVAVINKAWILLIYETIHFSKPSTFLLTSLLTSFLAITFMVVGCLIYIDENYLVIFLTS